MNIVIYSPFNNKIRYLFFLEGGYKCSDTTVCLSHSAEVRVFVL
jgi:hypothetical protein